MSDVLDLCPPGSRADADGMVLIGGCRADELAADYGTPALVVDESALRARAREYRDGTAASAGRTPGSSSRPRHFPAPRCRR